MVCIKLIVVSIVFRDSILKSNKFLRSRCSTVFAIFKNRSQGNLHIKRPDTRLRMGRGNNGVGWGCVETGQGQQWSENTISIDFASSKISRYPPTYLPTDLGTHALIDSLSKRRKKATKPACKLSLPFLVIDMLGSDKAGIWASRLGFGPWGQDMGLKAGIWASKLGFEGGHERRRRRRRRRRKFQYLA